MPRPHPPRKRPRRRPDAVERAARAEVSLAKQTAQVKERNVSADSKSPNAKPQPAAKGAKGTKGGAPAKVRRIDEPYVPWAKRSYAILVVLMAAGEVVIGALAWFTLSNPRPAFGVFLLGVNADSLGPLIAVAAALVAAQIAKYLSGESRALRFMESAIAGVTQYFIWLALFVGLVYLLGLNTVTPASTTSPSSTATPLATSSASPAATATATPSSSGSSSTSTAETAIATPEQVAGLALVDVLSFVGTYYLYPPLYRRLRIKPPPPRTPRPPKDPKPKDDAAKGPTSNGGKSNVERLDDAAARDAKPRDPTP